MMALYSSTNRISERTTYYGTVTGDFDAVQILRMNSSGDKQWNYSNNSSVNGSKRWLYMTADCTWNDTWFVGDSGSGTTWRNNVDIVKKSSEQTPSSATTRFFVYNSGSHFNPVAIRAWGGSATTTIAGSAQSDGTIYLFNFFEDDNSVRYGYADIPTNVTGFKIINCDSEDYNAYDKYYSDSEFTISGNKNCVFYCPNEGNNVTVGGAKDNVAGANLISKVIEAIDTCSSSEVNGYGTYSTLNNYYFSHATSDALAATATSLNGSNVTIQSHIDGMSRRASNTGNGSRIINVLDNDNSELAKDITIIIFAILISASVITGYFLLRKKEI